MDCSRSSIINLSPYSCHEKSLGQGWVCTNVELEWLKMQAQEEIWTRDEQLRHLNKLLYKATKDRDEALHKCQTLHAETETLLLHHQQQHIIKDEPNRDRHCNNNNLSSSDGDESIVSSPATHQKLKQTSKLQSFHEEVMQRSLPEKGKLLQAVMNAGPLLQTLILSGPLPQWRHPPPALQSFEIPPVPTGFAEKGVSLVLLAAQIHPLSPTDSTNRTSPLSHSELYH